jgi:hypothetical protein
MTDDNEPGGLGAVPRRAAEAAAALDGLKEPAERAAASIEGAFDRAGASLTRSLARAAADGEVSLAELARAVLAAINSAAGGGVPGVWPMRSRRRRGRYSRARARTAGRLRLVAPISSANADRSCSGPEAPGRSSRRLLRA